MKKFDQTEELNKAKLEFIRRNEKEFQNLKELLKRNEKKRDELTSGLASISGKLNQEQKERWDFFYSEAILDEELAEFINKIDVPKAVNPVWRWLDYSMEIAYQDMAKNEPVIFDKQRYEYLKTKFYELSCRDAQNIFMELTNGRPGVHLLLGVDLTRNKSAILEEVERLIAEHQKKLGIHEMPGKRFKWLPMLDDLMAVWDLRKLQKGFPEIARELGIDSDTAKKRFYRAAELITDGKYNRDNYKRDFWAIRIPDLKKHCGICPDHPDKGGSCDTLCPDAMDFVTQDEQYQREMTGGDVASRIGESGKSKTIIHEKKKDLKKAHTCPFCNTIIQEAFGATDSLRCPFCNKIISAA